MFQALEKPYLQKLKIELLFKILSIVVLLLSLIYSFFKLRTVTYDQNILNKKYLVGKINFYKIDGNKLTLEVRSKKEIYLLQYKISSLNEKTDLMRTVKVGNSIKVEGSLKIPENNTIFNTFNYKKYLLSKKIKYIFNVNNITKIKTGKSVKNFFIKRINNCKDKDYLFALIMGDKSYLDMKNYQKLGVSHLFAISGMHTAFVTSFLEKRLKIKNKLIILFFVWLYTYFVYFQVGVLRVAMMKTIRYLLKCFNIKLSNRILLVNTFSILLIINPFYVYNYGFWYSFIISFYIMSANYKDGYIKNLIYVSFIAFISSIPINILLSYKINVFTIFSNMIFVPFLSFIIFPLSIITFLFPCVETIFSLIIKATEFLASNFISLDIVMPKISIVLVLLYYLFLFFKLKSKKNYYYFALIIILCINKFFYLIDNGLYAYYIDVGQGDASLIYSPRNKKSILIDSGGKINFKKEKWMCKKSNYVDADNLVTFMNSLGISELTYFVTSHGDYDHMGEAINLVENFKVEKVIFNCGEFNDLEKELIKVLDKKKIKYYSCIKELNIDNSKLYFLQTKEYDNENDNSNVIYTELDGYKFMFMGDAGVEKEKDILEKYNLSNIDVLKVGHHGSKTSSSKEFINEINPKYSIISVGKNNRYGHPNKEVLNSLEDAKIYRTDQDGSIMFEIKNNELKIETCKP